MKLTKKQVDELFIQDYMPSIKAKEQEYRKGSNTKDIPMRCQAYNDFVDSLSKDRQITSSQAERFCIPSYLIK